MALQKKGLVGPGVEINHGPLFECEAAGFEGAAIEDVNREGFAMGSKLRACSYTPTQQNLRNASATRHVLPQ